MENRVIGVMIRVFANGLGDQGSILGRLITKTQKLVLDAAFLNTRHYKVRVKWSNPGNGVAPSLHHGVSERCLWCNCYRRWKWTRRHEFKSWTRLIAFHIAPITLGKVWILLFSLQLRVNGREGCVLQPWWGI